ncbi:hypothetical protein KUTeg_018451 [Tegillarca granosa]|uniref:Uncharacterized protein n=1 Tax=Tegillarca granosa TaxID=220873 RepID=A0ABQ9EHX7_TEGGR|nr:hypothetical protein KUTeg_018451 [Tegillarca granosa]
MLAEAIEEKMLRPVNLEGTRWMPHLSGSLDVLLKKYNIFVAHFENVVAAKTGFSLCKGRAKNVLKHLKDRNNVDDNGQFKGVKLSALTVTPEQIKNTEDGLIDSVIIPISMRIGSIDLNENRQLTCCVWGTSIKNSFPALHRFEWDIHRLQQTEWPALKAQKHQQAAGIGAQLMYQRLFTDLNLSVNFQNILMLVEIILCIPNSCAVSGRGFSAIARIKLSRLNCGVMVGHGSEGQNLVTMNEDTNKLL